MSDLLAVLTQLSAHARLKHLTLLQLLDFLWRASALKRDIALTQPASVPTITAPEVLPPLVQAFLADSTGIDLATIPDVWDILKNHAWAMTPLVEYVEKEKGNFREFGWHRGLSKSEVINQMAITRTC